MVLPQGGLDLKAIVDAFENHLVDQALARTSGNKNRASELLMMNRTTLVEKLRKRGMITPVGKGPKSNAANATDSTPITASVATPASGDFSGAALSSHSSSISASPEAEI